MIAGNRPRGGAILLLYTRNLRAAIALLCAACMLASCTRTVRLDPSEYSELQTGEGAGYRVTTTDGTVYDVRKAAIHDNIVTLDDPLEPLHDSRTYPVSLELSDIKSIDRLEPGNAPKVVAVVVVITAVVVALLARAYRGFGGGSN